MYQKSILFFVIFRTIGKVTGSKLGAHLAKSPTKVKKYIAGGLIYHKEA